LNTPIAGATCPGATLSLVVPSASVLQRYQNKVDVVQ
jgi:hypothetical protein